MKKNQCFIILCLMLLWFPVCYVQAQNQITKATVEDSVRDYWNLGVGYNAKENNYTAYALDLKTLQTVSDTQSNSNTLRYTIIEDKYQLSDTSFLGIDLGLEVSVPFVEIKASTSMDIYNSIETSQHSVSMIISYEHIKETLDVINADFSESARDYYITNGKEAFIAKYGDRYLDKIDIGGKLNFVYRLSVSERSNIDKFKLKVACEVLVAKVFKGEVDIEHEKLTEEEMSQIVQEVDVFYNGLPWRAEVRNYEDYCDLRDHFLDWLNTNTVVVKKQYRKYNELEFLDNVFYATLNEWYRLREIVNLAKRKAQSERNWDMETACIDALYEINMVISEMKPDEIPMPPTLSAYKEILDYGYDEENQLERSKAMPVGTVVTYMGDAIKVPIGWMLCDGSAIDKYVFSDLYGVIGDNYTNGETDSDFFNLPDLRGQFLRGLDASGNVDPDGVDREVGSFQEDAFQGHTHQFDSYRERGDTMVNKRDNIERAQATSILHGNTLGLGKPVAYDNFGDPRTSSETRPKNVAVNFIIKY